MTLRPLVSRVNGSNRVVYGTNCIFLVLQATAYGKCILADYQSVHKDMCVKEFGVLKDCYLVRL